MTRLRISLGVAFVLIVVGSASAPAGADLRARMAGLFSTLTQLSVILNDDARFEDPANRENVDQLLGVLAADATQIAEHAEPFRGEGFQRLAGGLAEDAASAMSRHEAGDAVASRRMVRKLGDACFACHSSLPGTMGGGELYDPARVQSLPLAEQMRWAVVAREFDTAAGLGQQALLSSTLTAKEIDRSGVLEDYLVVSVRVRGDLRTPRAALAMFLERDDIPEELAPVVRSWIQDLANADPFAYSKPKLQTGLELMTAARGDRRHLVQTVLASALLHQFVQSDPQDPEEAAVAYHLLGTAENEIRHSRDPRVTRILLETSIHVAPRLPVARDAYTLLEKILVADYAERLQQPMPEETRAQLDALRALAFRD